MGLICNFRVRGGLQTRATAGVGSNLGITKVRCLPQIQSLMTTKLGDCLSNSWSQCFMVIKKDGGSHLQDFNGCVYTGLG